MVRQRLCISNQITNGEAMWIVDFVDVKLLKVVARASCVDSLPSLNATRTSGPSGPVQIIVPYYSFTCPATLLSMTVKVSGNESGNSALYAQIWRPSPVSPDNYYTVWAGSYPDTEVGTTQKNARSGDEVVFNTKIGAGFPLLANDVVGLRVVGQGLQVAYTTSLGGMNTQAVQDPNPCNISLCNTHTTQGMAPILTVEINNDTVAPIIIVEYSRQYKFCNQSLIIPCPTTSVPGPQATPTPETTPTPTYQLPPSATPNNKVTPFPVSIVASVPSALFVVMVAAVLVLLVLCVRRKRRITKRVDCVASSGHTGSDRLSSSHGSSSVPGMGGYSRDSTPNGHEGVQLRHVGPHPLNDPSANGSSQPHHYSILEIEDFNLIPPSPSTLSPPVSLPPPSSSPSIMSPLPTGSVSAELSVASHEATPTGATPTSGTPGGSLLPSEQGAGHSLLREGLGSAEQSHRYQSPACSETGLYSQLNESKYSELPRSSVRLLTPLGSGNFGQVLLGECGTSEGRVIQVAVKSVKSGSKEMEKVKLLQEAAIMGQFSHPNVVRLIGIVTVGEPLLVVLEYMPKGDLCSFLHKMNPRRSKGAVLPPSLPSQFIRFAKDIASGMCYLSKRGFVHRDLAARNVLLTNDLVCKIGDFGMARDIEFENEYYVSHGGVIPVKWTAPEALNHRKYTSASDVWSYGMVLFEIWSLGVKPFSDLTNPIVSVYWLPWNPEHSCRPSFDSIHDYLDSDEGSLLQWLPEDVVRNRQAHVLGAPMTEANDLYLDLQRTYQQRQI
eukprot:Em0020g1031a